MSMFSITVASSNVSNMLNELVMWMFCLKFKPLPWIQIICISNENWIGVTQFFFIVITSEQFRFKVKSPTVVWDGRMIQKFPMTNFYVSYNVQSNSSKITFNQNSTFSSFELYLIFILYYILHEQDANYFACNHSVIITLTHNKMKNYFIKTISSLIEDISCDFSFKDF